MFYGRNALHRRIALALSAGFIVPNYLIRIFDGFLGQPRSRGLILSSPRDEAALSVNHLLSALRGRKYSPEALDPQVVVGLNCSTTALSEFTSGSGSDGFSLL